LEEFLKLEHLEDHLILEITEGVRIEFRKEWVRDLLALPYDHFGEYFKSNIYPALRDSERQAWHRVAVSNLELQTALAAYNQ
jgi:hypothetical protein